MRPSVRANTLPSSFSPPPPPPSPMQLAMPDTSSPAELGNVLILGGLAHVGRALLCHLLSLRDDAGNHVVRHIRFADKYLVAGNASTTYIDPKTSAALQDPRAEYRQANLLIREAASAVFDAPNGEQYDAVFDLAGEGMLGHDVSGQLLLERTTKLTGALSRLAAERRVKAYVRDTPPFWMTKPNGEAAYVEADRAKEGEASTPRAYYFYEAERAAASVTTLPLVILRSANVYGPHQFHGTLTPKIALGEVYAYLGEPMKVLWSSDIRSHAVHVHDFCTAAWAAAKWAAVRSREQMNAEAGVALVRIKPRDKLKLDEADDGTCAVNVCPKAVAPIAPVFNIADNDDMTLGKILKVVGQVYGIETGFTNAAINTWAKLNLSSVVDESNDKHTEAMTQMASEQDPPLFNSPLTIYLSVEDLAQQSVSLDSGKAQETLGWMPRERFDVASVQEVIRSFKDADAWIRR